MPAADRSERRKPKAGIDAGDCRRNRAAQKVELRKQKRDEGLQKRRNLVAEDAEATAAAEVLAGGLTPDAGALSSLGETALGFVSRNGPPDEFDGALAAVKALRKKLSLAHGPPIDEVIGLGLVPAFVTMLRHPNEKMQFEAAWCLTNIASGNKDQCQAVVSHNAVPSLVALVGSESVEVSPSPPLTLT